MSMVLIQYTIIHESWKQSIYQKLLFLIFSVDRYPAGRAIKHVLFPVCSYKQTRWHLLKFLLTTAHHITKNNRLHDNRAKVTYVKLTKWTVVSWKVWKRGIGSYGTIIKKNLIHSVRDRSYHRYYGPGKDYTIWPWLKNLHEAMKFQRYIVV